MSLARELQLHESDIADDLARVRASLTAVTLAEEIASGRLPVVTPDKPLAGYDVCHFHTPVRLGRRRSDRFGDLLMTSGWLKFRGPSDLTIAWTEVAAIQRAHADLIVVLEDRRALRFACQSIEAAARGGVIAQHLRDTAAAYGVSRFSSAATF